MLFSTENDLLLYVLVVVSFSDFVFLQDKRREEVEVEIAQMELEERAHIERLKELQEEQKAAYDALELALAS